MAFSTSTFKRIDHYLGLPLCALISLWYGVLKLIRKPVSPAATPAKALIIKFFGIGSICYSTVIVRDLKKRFPGIRITLLTFKENRAFAEYHGAYDEVVTVDRKRPVSFVIDTVLLLWRHLHRPYDICIDLEYFSKYTSIHAAFTRAPIRIGFYMHCLWRRYIYTHQSYFNTAKHIRGIYGLVSKMAGCETSDETVIPIPLTETQLDHAREILKTEGWDGRQPFVGVNVNASDLALARRWPPSHFAGLISAIARSGHLALLTGAPSETDYVGKCMDMVDADAKGGVRNIAGKLSIVDLFAMMKLCRLYVTNDSGPMIFTYMVGAPSVSIWGPGDPEMYGGTPPHHTWVYSRYPCSPCMYVPMTEIGHFCGFRYPCMEAIKPEQVAEEVMRRIEESRIA
jgi:ADP-heptose:LPS heptosyltransferase